MKNRKSTVVLLFGSIVAFVVGWVLTSASYVVSFGLCLSKTDTSCVGSVVEGYGQPIFLLSIVLAIASTTLIFLRQEAFVAWKKFAIWAMPIGVILIALTPVQGGSGTIGVPSLDREIITWLVSGVFLLISLWIIVRASIANKEA